MNDVIPAQQNVLDDMDTLDRIIKFAELMASGRCTLPKEYHNNPGDCLALSLQAQAWGMNPFTVAQKSYVIKGKLGYEAQLVNAVITRHAPITGRPQFRYSDGWEKVLGKFRTVKGQNGPYKAPDWQPKDEEGLWCEVSATMIGEAEPRVVRMLLVQAHPRQSTQWATDPKQQLSYACMRRWARLHCPDVILGVFTADEMKDREPGEKDVTPLKAALSQQGESVTVRKDSKQPPVRSDADHPDGEKLTGTENTPKTTHKDYTECVDTAKDRTDGIRKILHEQKQVPITEPNEQDRATLQMAIDSIASCDSIEQLKECGGDLEGKLHPEFVKEVRVAYKRRMAELS